MRQTDRAQWRRRRKHGEQAELTGRAISFGFAHRVYDFFIAREQRRARGFNRVKHAARHAFSEKFRRNRLKVVPFAEILKRAERPFLLPLREQVIDKLLALAGNRRESQANSAFPFKSALIVALIDVNRQRVNAKLRAFRKHRQHARRVFFFRADRLFNHAQHALPIRF